MIATSFQGGLRPCSTRVLSALLVFGFFFSTALCGLGTEAKADRLVTVDKRILDVRKVRKAEGGGYILTFEHGVIECPESQIASVEIEGDMSDYEPKNDKERDFLEKGYVRYHDRWMSKKAYQAELNREAKAARERVAILEEHANFYDGWVQETKHFIIKTNTSPELLEYYADLLEAYYDLMNKRVGIKPTPRLKRTKMQVNIYKNREEFNDLSGTPPGVAGYFSFLAESLNFYHDYEDPTVSDWIALHECTHLLTYLIEPQAWPRIWINEGVADYFGSSTITRDKRGRIQIEPGKLQVDRIITVQQAIKDGDYVPLEKLFRLEKANFGAFEYAHAWSFVYFLNNSKKAYRKGFNKFFELNYTIPKSVEYTMERFPNLQGTAKILSAEEVRRLILSSLKLKDDDVLQLEKEWLSFVENIEVDAPAARFKRAYRIVRSYDNEQFDQAEEDLNFAIASGLDDPRAYWARALLKYRKADHSGAEEDLLKAIEMSPLDARFRYSLAGLLSGRGLSFGSVSIRISYKGGWKLEGTEEEVELALEQYGLATELDPENENFRDSYEEYLAAYDTWKEKQE